MIGRGRIRRRPVLLFAGAVVLSAAIVWLWVNRDRPPIQELKEVRIYSNYARANAREEEAEPILRSVQENLDRAQSALDGQFRRLVLFRNYDVARYHISRARMLCNDALATSRLARRNAVADCQRRLVALQRSLRTTRSLIERLALKDGARVRVVSAESRLQAADSRLADHDTGEVRGMLDAAEEDIAEAAAVIQGHLAEFLSRRQQWDAWIKQTLEESRRTDRPVILVDKLNHECYVLRRGRVSDSYPVELGGEWMLAKLREGDQATPEGCYRVTALKGGSRFYKAALLSYPNEADRARFVRAKRAGQLPGGARIGGLIEIHGEGGRGADWTAGCVSLTNRDFDRFLRNVQLGTQVTIVGLWQEPNWLRNVGSPDSDRPEAGSD